MVFGKVGGDGGLFEEVVEKWKSTGHAAEGVCDLLAGGFAEGDDFSGSGDRIS